MKSFKVKRLFIICVCSSILYLLVYFIQLRTMQYYQDKIRNSGQYFIDTYGCRMPYWNPFHSSIKNLIEPNMASYDCERKPSFLGVLPKASIHINRTILFQQHNLFPGSVNCTYQNILRDPGKNDQPTDDEVMLLPARFLPFDISLDADGVYVQCFDSSGTMFHDEYLALTPTKMLTNGILKTSNLFGEPDKLNVIILGIDSISKLNFERHLTKTRSFLKNEMEAFEMFGYNKVGENTFPNLVPFLTGHFHEHYYNESLKDMFFDELDFVWKHYSRNGYKTLFAEDAPDVSLFNYERKGFKMPPTNYYMRPFAMAVLKSHVLKRSKKPCLDDKTEMQVVYDYVMNFVETMGKQPFFAFSFIASLTHNFLNYAAFADSPTYDILQRLYNKNVTNNSLVILMSDHGIRFGPIRETYIGKFEDRWPISFISLPKWFLRKYPIIERNLRINQQRLTTHFDMHETLLDFLRIACPTNQEPVKEFRQPKGVSLFKEISPHRTCKDAAIPKNWCTCQQFLQISLSEKSVVLSASALMYALNRVISPHLDICSYLLMKEIKDARIGQIDGRFTSGYEDRNSIDIIVTISVRPGGGIFEATVQHQTSHEQYKVVGDISRINAYGHDGDCIRSAIIRKFCYCIEKL